MLPDTLLKGILSYLDVKSKVRIAHVCLYLRLLVGSKDVFWWEQCDKQFKAYTSREKDLEEFLKQALRQCGSNNTKISRLPLDALRRFCVIMQLKHNWEYGHYTIHKLSIPWSQTSAFSSRNVNPGNKISHTFVCKNRGLVTVDRNDNIYFASYYAKPMKLQPIKQPSGLQLTNENSSEERISFTELKNCRYKTEASTLSSTLAIGTDYFVILAFPSLTARFARFIVFWKLECGKLAQVRWFRLQENVQCIKSLHKNWLVVNGYNVSLPSSLANKTFVYNLQDAWIIGINAHSGWDRYLVQYAISDSINVLVPQLKRDPLRLRILSEQIDTVTSFMKHVMSWTLDQTWKNVSISSCTIEPYPNNSFVLYTNESQGSLAITSLSHHINTQTTIYNGVLRCVSSMDARAFIEGENNSWYIMELKSRDKTYIGSISSSSSYIGMTLSKYIVIACRNIGFLVLAERMKKLTELYRVPKSNLEADVDDIAIVCTKPDRIDIIDFSGLIDSVA